MCQLDRVFFCLNTPLRNTSHGLHILSSHLLLKMRKMIKDQQRITKKYDMDDVDDVIEQRRHATFHFKLLRNPERED